MVHRQRRKMLVTKEKVHRRSRNERRHRRLQSRSENLPTASFRSHGELNNLSPVCLFERTILGLQVIESAFPSSVFLLIHPVFPHGITY